MFCILTRKSNTECTECDAQDVEIIAVRSSLKKGLESIKIVEPEKSHYYTYELTGYVLGVDPVKSTMIASLDWRINVERRKPEWTLWIADEYKENWCDGKRK